MRYRLAVFTFLSVLLFVGCAFITVNITFEQAKEQIAEEAKKITKTIAESAKIEIDTSKDKDGVVADDKIDIETKNPKIRAILDAMKERARHLVEPKKKGNVGENNKGYLEIRDVEGVPLKARAIITQLVTAENNDRHQLYIEQCKAHKVVPNEENILKVGQEWAKAWAQAAQPGDWVQLPKGDWVKK